MPGNCGSRTQSVSAIKHIHINAHSWTAITHGHGTSLISPQLAAQKRPMILSSLNHHHCNTLRGGGMKVAIFRVRVRSLRRWLWARRSGNWVHIQMPFSFSAPRSLKLLFAPFLTSAQPSERDYISDMSRGCGAGRGGGGLKTWQKSVRDVWLTGKTKDGVVNRSSAGRRKTNIQTCIHAAICICTLQTKANTYIYTCIIYSAGEPGKELEKYAKCHSDCHPDLFCRDTHTDRVMAISFPQTSDIFFPTLFLSLSSFFFFFWLPVAVLVKLAFLAFLGFSLPRRARLEVRTTETDKGREKSVTRRGMETIGGMRIEIVDGTVKQTCRYSFAQDKRENEIAHGVDITVTCAVNERGNMPSRDFYHHDNSVCLLCCPDAWRTALTLVC